MEFRRIREVLYETCRIDLGDSKMDLVQARLGKRLQSLGLKRFRDYLRLVESDSTGQELKHMVDALTTNLTYFFREADHFSQLERYVKDKVALGQTRFRAWSAGCSSGEEAYTMAIVMNEALKDCPGRDLLILATDVSSRMIEAAESGLFKKDRLKGVPGFLRPGYFSREAGTGKTGEMYLVRPELKRMIRFRRHNLNGRWPMKGPFDIIFCRNVMIYFDKATQESLVDRFQGILVPGGLLVLGHSEGLLGARGGLTYLSPGMYSKAQMDGGRT